MIASAELNRQQDLRLSYLSQKYSEPAGYWRQVFLNLAEETADADTSVTPSALSEADSAAAPDTADSLWTRTETVSVITIRPDGAADFSVFLRKRQHSFQHLSVIRRQMYRLAGEMAAEVGATDKGTSLCEASKR